MAPSQEHGFISELLEKEEDTGVEGLEEAVAPTPGFSSKADMLSQQKVRFVRAVLVIAVSTAWLSLVVGRSFSKKVQKWQPEWAGWWFHLSPLLGSLAGVSCEMYLRTASTMPRPRYLHLAGLFLLLCTLDNFFIPLTVLFGAFKWAKVQVLFMIGIIGCEASAFGVVQVMILLKVMTLRNDQSGGVPLKLLQLAAALLCSWALLFASRVAFYGHIGTSAGVLESLAGGLFLLSFLGYTFSCAGYMFEAAGAAGMETSLLVHSGATVAANLASSLRFIYIAAAQHYQQDAVAARYVFANCFDNILNIVCALLVSGIMAAVLSSNAGSSVVGKVDVLQDIRQAAAQTQVKKGEEGLRRRGGA